MEIPRRALRQFRAVLRKSVLINVPRGTAGPAVEARADASGLSLRCANGDVAVAYQVDAEPRPAEEVLCFPSELLAWLEGSDDSAVGFSISTEGKGEARWSERGLEQTAAFEPLPPDEVPVPAAAPATMTPMHRDFLRMLDDACRTAGRDNTKYALTRVQLRGKQGEIAGTDSRQILLQNGLQFPFEEDLLVPALPAFGLRELEGKEAALGRTETHLAISVGPWRFDLTIDAAGRYPDVKPVIPTGNGRASVRFSEVDSTRLLAALPGLPGHDVDHRPVTLDLGSSVKVRAADAGGDAKELLLADSSCAGIPLAIAVDRFYLERGLRLGFREFRIVNEDKPIVGRDRGRSYAFMTLGSVNIAPPVAGAFAAAMGEPSIAAAPPATPLPALAASRGLAVPPAPAIAGGTGAADPVILDADPVEEAERLKAALAEWLARFGRLIDALRGRRREPDLDISEALRRRVGALRNGGKP